jgi:hypothetical protein
MQHTPPEETVMVPVLAIGRVLILCFYSTVLLCYSTVLCASTALCFNSSYAMDPTWRKDRWAMGKNRRVRSMYRTHAKAREILHACRHAGRQAAPATSSWRSRWDGLV